MAILTRSVVFPENSIANQGIAFENALTGNSTAVDLTVQSTTNGGGGVAVPLAATAAQIPAYAVCCKIKVTAITGSGTFTLKTATNSGISTGVQVVGITPTISALGYYTFSGFTDVISQRFLRLDTATFGAVTYDYQLIIVPIL